MELIVNLVLYFIFNLPHFFEIQKIKKIHNKFFTNNQVLEEKFWIIKWSLNLKNGALNK